MTTQPETNLDGFAQHVREIAIAHGWESSTRSFGEEVALWHSECSEALEEHRNGHADDEMYYGPEVCITCNSEYDMHVTKTFVNTHTWNPARKPEGIPIEAVDVIIRIMHWAARTGVSLDDALKIKAAYNETRPFRHGNKIL